MIKRLTLEHIAIIARAELTLEPGLTAITGETGSGKSILIDGVALAFGAKVSPKEIIQAGYDRAQVELLMDVPEDSLRPDGVLFAVLQQAGIDPLPDETELLISREFTPKGSRSRVNGIPVSRETVEAIRSLLIDLHGQHELTNLFDGACQRQYLDQLGGQELAMIKTQVAQTHQQWRTVVQELNRLKNTQSELEKQRDFLEFQCNELTEAQLDDIEEDVRIKTQLERLSHAEQLKTATGKAQYLISQDGAVQDGLYEISRLLGSVSGFDPELAAVAEELDGLLEAAKTLSQQLSRYHDQLEDDPETLQQLGQRLDELEKIKRKYGPTLPEVFQTWQTLQAQLASLSQSAEDTQALEAAELHLSDQLQTLCAQLSEQRRQTAKTLQTRIRQELADLALPAVQFDVDFQPSMPTADGMDAITFLFSANPGEPLRPLAKVASGGELSRFLLALKVILAHQGPVGTLVFDEIDTGISGATAKKVAEKLWRLAEHLQVLVITHQPVVAAVADHHWHVEKQLVEQADGQTVAVIVTNLEDEPQRLSTLSRLIHGEETATEVMLRLRQERQQWQRRASR